MIIRAFGGVATKLTDGVTLARVLAGAGLLHCTRPDVAVRATRALVRHGLSLAAAYGYGAARYPNALAVVDDRGTLTFAELSSQIDSLAATLETRGVGPGTRAGILCRNHREFVRAIAALSSLGADIVLLNVSFAAPQLAETLEAERITALVYDEEFAPQARVAARGLARLVAWPSPYDGSDSDRSDGSDGSEGPARDPVLAELETGRLPRRRAAPRSGSRYVLLTSGTTGRPKGTARTVQFTLDPLVALLSRIPSHSRDVTLIASPLFHAWGFGQLALATALSSTVVLQRRFDPEAVLRAVAHHRVRVLVVVPFMLRRLLELPESIRRTYDVSSLEIVASSGSELPGSLATEFMDVFGDVLYNVYGSTEAAWAAIATPRELRSAPRTAGTPPRGATVRVADDDGNELPAGRTGRILVRNGLLAADASAGAPGKLVDGFLPTGDRGHLDSAGRLFVEGREDDMIVSGGENVYPQEVEELLVTHPAIAEVAVVGVPDPRYGRRLRALVVLRRGAALSEDEVRNFVRERLAGYKVPRDVRFVDALARNETGKLLRTRAT